MKVRFLFAALVALAAPLAHGQDLATPPVPVAAVPVAALGIIPSLTIPLGAVVDLEVGVPISSQTGREGDTFALRLAAPLLIDGREVLPAGLTGVGEITTAAPSGFGGKPGKLLLSARYLDYDGRRILLKAFNLGGGGANNVAGAIVVTVAVGMVGFLVPGGNIEVPAGARGSGKIAAPFEIFPAPAPPQAATSQQDQTQ